MDLQARIESTDAAWAVVRGGRAYGLVARRSIAAGEVVLLVTGAETDRPSRGSLQVGERLHVEVPEGWDLEQVLDECPWRFLNHACDPNTWVRGRELVALRPITLGEPITFDYETTEWDMAAPFRCACGPGCRGGMVRGFRHLEPRERLRRLPHLAQHLRSKLDAATGRIR